MDTFESDKKMWEEAFPHAVARGITWDEVSKPYFNVRDLNPYTDEAKMFYRAERERKAREAARRRRWLEMKAIRERRRQYYRKNPRRSKRKK